MAGRSWAAAFVLIACAGDDGGDYRLGPVSAYRSQFFHYPEIHDGGHHGMATGLFGG